MRLTEFEKKAIKTEAKNIFGKDSRIFIFGSRIDDTQKGGDIDIFIIPEKKEELFKKKIKFLTNLQLKIGLQKIDVVIARDFNTDIEKHALNTGIEL